MVAMRRKRDAYTEIAKREGLRSRAYFKLKDIDERYGIFRPGDIVIDIGAAPGGWIKYSLSKIGFDGRVIGIDQREIEPFEEPNVVTIKADILGEGIFKSIEEQLGGEKADVIISDASPNISGVYEVDTEKIYDLNKRVIQIADRFLRPGGTLILKTFQGRHERQLVNALKKRFRRISTYKSKVSRKRSSEIYYICMGFIKPRKRSRRRGKRGEHQS